MEVNARIKGGGRTQEIGTFITCTGFCACGCVHLPSSSPLSAGKGRNMGSLPSLFPPLDCNIGIGEWVRRKEASGHTPPSHHRRSVSKSVCEPTAAAAKTAADGAATDVASNVRLPPSVQHLALLPSRRRRRRRRTETLSDFEGEEIT